jgi:hypothetical protein
MDHFETIVSDLLEAAGYWVRRSFKVDLTKEEKRRVGRHSMPRPEIDILAYKRATEKLLVLEAKSFLDSPGVSLDQLSETHEKPEGRYKLFTCENYRQVVLERLRLELQSLGMISQKTNLRLGLAAGKVHRRESTQVKALMDSQGWYFLSPEDIREQVMRFSDMGYENNPAVITAKILLRDM